LLTDYKQQDVKGWLVSEKLDGVRAYWDGQQLITRQGNRLSPPDWFVADFPPFELDGELWVGPGQFEHTLSIVSRFQPDERWNEVGYYVFELPNQPGGLVERLDVLSRYLIENKVSHLQLVTQRLIKHQDDLNQILNQSLAQGAEGLVVREPHLSYHTGRSPYALKVKPRYDAECKVTGYTDGRGKYTGQVGALLCLNLQQQLLRIGSGLTDAMRQDPPPIGATITYQYNGYTSSGWPRHAIFLRERTDGF
jgi:DNA ligase 1